MYLLLMSCAWNKYESKIDSLLYKTILNDNPVLGG
jgi:hypothetical protein